MGAVLADACANREVAGASSTVVLPNTHIQMVRGQYFHVLGAPPYFSRLPAEWAIHHCVSGRYTEIQAVLHNSSLVGT